MAMAAMPSTTRDADVSRYQWISFVDDGSDKSADAGLWTHSI
jgi:hypothetical protein